MPLKRIPLAYIQYSWWK